MIYCKNYRDLFAVVCFSKSYLKLNMQLNSSTASVFEEPLCLLCQCPWFLLDTNVWCSSLCNEASSCQKETPFLSTPINVYDKTPKTKTPRGFQTLKWELEADCSEYLSILSRKQNCVWHEWKRSQIAARQDQLLLHLVCDNLMEIGQNEFLKFLEQSFQCRCLLHTTPTIQQNKEPLTVIGFSFFSPETALQMCQADVLSLSLSSFCRNMKPASQSQHSTQVISHLSFLSPSSKNDSLPHSSALFFTF